MADEVWQVVLPRRQRARLELARDRSRRSRNQAGLRNHPRDAGSRRAAGSRTLTVSADCGRLGSVSEATRVHRTASPTPYPRAAALAEESGRQDDSIADVQLASWPGSAVALMLDSVVLVIILVVLFAIAALSDPSFDDAAAESAGDDDLTAGWIIFLLGVFFGPFLYTWLMLGAWGATARQDGTRHPGRPRRERPAHRLPAGPRLNHLGVVAVDPLPADHPELPLAAVGLAEPDTSGQDGVDHRRARMMFDRFAARHDHSRRTMR